jgi:hypothetical protein
VGVVAVLLGPRMTPKEINKLSRKEQNRIEQIRIDQFMETEGGHYLKMNSLVFQTR